MEDMEDDDGEKTACSNKENYCIEITANNDDGSKTNKDSDENREVNGTVFTADNKNNEEGEYLIHSLFILTEVNSTFLCFHFQTHIKKIQISFVLVWIKLMILQQKCVQKS